MTYRILTGLTLAAALSLSACSNAEKRDDGTAGTAVTDLDSAADNGGVKADAVVIDNNAGPTVTPSAADSAALDKSGTTQP